MPGAPYGLVSRHSTALARRHSRGHKRKGPVFRPGLRSRAGLLDRADVLRLRALGALRDVERHLLVFLQRLEAAALDRREVREEVLAAVVGRDEAEALGIVEPLDGTCAHVCLPK